MRTVTVVGAVETNVGCYLFTKQIQKRKVSVLPWIGQQPDVFIGTNEFPIRLEGDMPVRGCLEVIEPHGTEYVVRLFPKPHEIYVEDMKEAELCV